ncbi:carboxylesterase/lipase family protein [Sphingobium indicum]|uniref:carboxylesterase/lipase family protein n=1 Tax=Sphingobium indicum TaxID=332055 RepID=UPI0013EA1EE8|nr:carboxylesterase family protein [Sphingobium indicum]NYI23660.1 para-nitrobenzyl esterase [Sphingobium indicum]
MAKRMVRSCLAHSLATFALNLRTGFPNWQHPVPMTATAKVRGSPLHDAMPDSFSTVDRDTPLGPVRGLSINGCEVFHGLPFAQPPVGTLRFLPPVPSLPRNKIRDATAPAPMAPQTVSRMFSALGSISGAQDEDCLTLSIWAPAGVSNAPTMVWFHGGAFLTGAGSQAWYDGARMAREHGVVLVCPNYRLGALGYLSAQGVSDGNLGLWDQLAALHWVQQNISAFGGDAGNVTVFGQSAGAHAIAMLLASEDSAGLFKRAILQSAPMGLEPLSQQTARERSRLFIHALGLDNSRDGNLGIASVERILAAQDHAGALLRNPRKGDFIPPFAPVADAPWNAGDTPLWKAAAQGAAKRNVDVMIGWTRDEGALFFSLLPDRANIDGDFTSSVADGLFGNGSAAGIEAARARRAPPDDAALCEELLTDALFRSGSLAFAEALSALGGNVHVYRFDMESPAPDLRACHCMDLPFVFGNVDAWNGARMLDGLERSQLEGLSASVMARWTGFARGGDPGVATWTPENRVAMIMDGSGCEMIRVEDAALF